MHPHPSIKHARRKEKKKKKKASFSRNPTYASLTGTAKLLARLELLRVIKPTKHHQKKIQRNKMITLCRAIVQ